MPHTFAFDLLLTAVHTVHSRGHSPHWKQGEQNCDHIIHPYNSLALWDVEVIWQVYFSFDKENILYTITNMSWRTCVVVKQIQSNLYTITCTWYLQFDGLLRDCSNSIANTLELLQSCTKHWDNEIPAISCVSTSLCPIIQSTTYPWSTLGENINNRSHNHQQ